MKRIIFRINLVITLVGLALILLGIGGLFWLTPDGPCVGLMSHCYPTP